MKLLLSGILLIGSAVLGQAPRETNSYLTSQNVSKVAKDFYNKKFKAADDDRTLSIVDSLNTKNDLTRPFYIYLVSMMMKKSDAALSEALGVACKDFVETHPNNLIEFLYSGHKTVSTSFLEDWARQIGWEIQLSCEHREKECLKNSYHDASTKIKSAYKTRLKQFYNRIESFSH